jgi:LmbE family N-acetylglucosaminyl deacetylase
MIGLQLKKVRTILCLGSHSDDIEIGCGGTILKLLAENNSVDVFWIVFSATEARADEANRSAELFLEKASNKNIIVKKFRETFFPYCATEIKEFFKKLQSEISPDLIFTHRREDLHQDHRLVSELTWNTFRDHLIMEYEIPKYEGDLGQPNIFVKLSRQTCEQKVATIFNTFLTQRTKKWFSEDTFWALLRLRGVESNSEFAEGLYCRKMIM